MTIQECYKEMGGDFEGVQKRFGGVALVEKFAIKFLSDSSFQDLERKGCGESILRGTYPERNLSEPGL